MLYLALVCGCMQVEGIRKLCLQLVYTGYHNYVFTATTESLANQLHILTATFFYVSIYEGRYHASNSCKCTEVHGKACLAGTHSGDKLYTAIHIRMCIKTNSVLQATLKSHNSCENLYQVLNTLESHTFCKEEGSGHAVADELSLRNAIIKQRILIRC